jgi:hypothetical protein
MLEVFYMYIRGFLYVYQSFLYAKMFFMYTIFKYVFYIQDCFLKKICARTFLKKKINDGAMETISITDIGENKNAIFLFFFLTYTGVTRNVCFLFFFGRGLG